MPSVLGVRPKAARIFSARTLAGLPAVSMSTIASAPPSRGPSARVFVRTSIPDRRRLASSTAATS